LAKLAHSYFFKKARLTVVLLIGVERKDHITAYNKSDKINSTADIERKKKQAG